MAFQNKFGRKTTALEVVEGVNLNGSFIIVTGGAGGIGIETVRALAKTGATVVIAARDLKKANQVAEEIKKSTGNDGVEVEELELGSLKSIRLFVSRYLSKNRPLHILVNNAAAIRAPQGKTEDGFETHFGVNHIGHFALTVGLLPALKFAKGARVIMVSSIAHAYSDVDLDDPNFVSRPYDPQIAYGQSKSANILFAVELTKRYSKDNIFANSLTPGGIITEGLLKNLTIEKLIAAGWLDETGNKSPHFKTIEEGAATTVWAAITPELKGRGGLYLQDCQIAQEASWESIEPAVKNLFRNGFPWGYLARAVDPIQAHRLWEITEQMIDKALK